MSSLIIWLFRQKKYFNEFGCTDTATSSFNLCQILLPVSDFVPQ